MRSQTVFHAKGPFSVSLFLGGHVTDLKKLFKIPNGNIKIFIGAAFKLLFPGPQHTHISCQLF